MKVLIIDTSTTYLYVRFYDNEKHEVLFQKDMISHNNHSENLLTVINLGLMEKNMKLSDFDKVIVGNGPGSYTGLRIGMVVAKMTSFLLNIPLYIISSLSFCASGYLTSDGIYGVSIIAKKDYSYGKVFSVKNGVIEVLEDDCFMETTLFQEVKNKYQSITIDESNYQINEEIIDKLSTYVSDVHNLVPNYLRKANS